MQGLISRQDAIDAIFSEPLYESGMKKRYADVVVPAIYEKIKSLPSAQPETHWIPCSERLPNHDEYIKNNGLFIVSDGNRSYSEWYDIYDKRKFGEPTMSGFRIDYAVTAWMPLPEPYIKEGEQ